MLTRRNFIRLGSLWSAAALCPGLFRLAPARAQTDPTVATTLARFAVLSDTHVAVPYSSYSYDSPYVDSDPGMKLHPESRFILENIVVKRFSPFQ